MLMFQRSVAAVAVLALLCAPAFGQNGETQDEHDKQIKADTERNTKYHNNADDYPVNKPPVRRRLRRQGAGERGATSSLNLPRRLFGLIDLRPEPAWVGGRN